MLHPRFETREHIEAARAGRGFRAKAAGLWCAGSLQGLGRACIAVVGTRAATAYGRRQAHRFGAELGAAGCCVVSGLALGIDAAAHEGALEAGALTIGVLGGGHHRFYPPRNMDLAERIVARGGAVLSPFPPDHDARPWQFLQRNGIVVTLCDALVVVEAPMRSGALNTASWASNHCGMPVLAVPADVDRPHSQGCLALLRDGATLARSGADVLEAIGISGVQPALALCDAGHESRDAKSSTLLRALEGGALSFDQLIATSGLGVSDAVAALAMLELQGAVESCGTSTYSRVGVASGGEEQGREPRSNSAARLS